MSITTQAYAQWIALEIINESSAPTSIFVTGCSLNWGKLYDGNDKDNEIGVGKVVGHEIKAGESFTIWSSGRENASSGTEGTVTVSTAKTGGSKIAAIHWDCPWSGDNDLKKKGTQLDGWIVDVPSVDPDGAIGHVEVVFFKRRSRS